MEYFICRESYISKVNEYNDGGLNVKGIVNTKLRFDFGTRSMGRYFYIGGGQGGLVNAPRYGVSSSPNLGLPWFHDSFGSMAVMLYWAL